MKTITVFTPTYNRKELLKRCYESLVFQTDKDFVWQIIDDGSTDGTRELVEEFIKEDKIDIEYYWKENGGKTSAINKSLELLSTPYWVCLDSDDYFFKNSIELLKTECKKIESKKEICGIFCVRSAADGKPMKGIDVTDSLIEATQEEIRYKYNIPPEYVQVYKSEVVKDIRFPIFEGERFMVLSWMQDQIDQKYKFRIIHNPIMVCEYQTDGITKNYYRLMCKNPNGFLAFYEQRIRNSKVFKTRFLAAINYNALFDIFKPQNKDKLNDLIVCLAFIPSLYVRRLIQRKGMQK